MAVTPATRIRVLYFVKSIMFNVLEFSSMSAIIITAFLGSHTLIH